MVRIVQACPEALMQVPKLKHATTGARECLIDVLGTKQAFINVTIGGVVGMKRH
jgi:hypothetical protein